MKRGTKTRPAPVPGYTRVRLVERFLDAPSCWGARRSPSNKSSLRCNLWFFLRWLARRNGIELTSCRNLNRGLLAELEEALKDADEETIRAYRKHVRRKLQQEAVSEVVARNRMYAVEVFYGWALEKEVVEHDPTGTNSKGMVLVGQFLAASNRDGVSTRLDHFVHWAARRLGVIPRGRSSIAVGELRELRRKLRHDGAQLVSAYGRALSSRGVSSTHRRVSTALAGVFCEWVKTPCR